MTRTIVASARKEIVIGFDQPFCVIGERINPTGRKKLAAEMVDGNFDTVRSDARAQVAAGATMLDVNAGVTAVDPNATEPALLVQTLEIVQDLVDVPLSIDSSVTAAIEAALQVAKGRPLVNSVTGEEEKLEAILPLVKKYDVPVVAISNDETGISMDPDVRFAVARKIVERAMDYGIKPEDVVVDPLVMPIGALGDAGRQVFALLRRLREEHHLRPVQHLLRPAPPSRHQRRLHSHGHRRRHDLGDHEPLPTAGDGGRARRQRAGRHRPGLRHLDQDLQGLQTRRRRQRARRTGGRRRRRRLWRGASPRRARGAHGCAGIGRAQSHVRTPRDIACATSRKLRLRPDGNDRAVRVLRQAWHTV
jgi:hypothetical protein